MNDASASADSPIGETPYFTRPLWHDAGIAERAGRAIRMLDGLIESA